MIKHLISPPEKDLGEFSVRRVLPYAKQRMVGPWVFFDHMGPAQFEAGQGVNVRPHPHINLATVTYLFEGEILHRDSLGSYAPIRPGDINLMVAGRGITHSERERDEVRNAPHRLHGLQLWHALPEQDEEIEPAFYHYPSADIPGLDIGGVAVRVMMGSAYGVTSPVKTFAETIYAEANLAQGQQLIAPTAEQLAVYVAEGEIQIGEEVVPQFNMAILESAAMIHISARQAAKLAFIGGAAMSPRFIEWNFVSSRAERIEQAKQDWRDGKFPLVQGDEDEFIPLPGDD
ncbi:MAG: pirin family protein [Gammaproteobacteria bacterium]|nr:pirin family protein [Gammaproteobacteria bacterium]